VQYHVPLTVTDAHHDSTKEDEVARARGISSQTRLGGHQNHLNISNERTGEIHRFCLVSQGTTATDTYRSSTWPASPKDGVTGTLALASMLCAGFSCIWFMQQLF